MKNTCGVKKIKKYIIAGFLNFKDICRPLSKGTDYVYVKTDVIIEYFLGFFYLILSNHILSALSNYKNK